MRLRSKPYYGVCFWGRFNSSFAERRAGQETWPDKIGVTRNIKINGAGQQSPQPPK
ncbi:hypothetical protein NIASO_00455 [Niabella soli DSM 19437]|uniref:Uncharacterized protein n=1 Tax=Niabella soli DSM 19437 TaxID=929713 RepID=W0F1T9_9BACT|nr:hypothetical protein NIASO_00455 [Niabella soli DSM 19437]